MGGLMNFFGKTNSSTTKIKKGDTFYRHYNDQIYVIVTKVKRNKIYFVRLNGDIDWTYREILRDGYRLGPSIPIPIQPKYKCINSLPRKVLWQRKLSRMFSSGMRVVSNVARRMRGGSTLMEALSVFLVTIIIVTVFMPFMLGLHAWK